jgi:hypothetical protein
MNPNIRTTPIMDYVRAMEQKCRRLETERAQLERPVFFWGMGWGFATGVIASFVLWWYTFHHGG